MRRATAFLAAPWSVLMLGKTDCEHCASYTDELHALLASDTTYVRAEAS